MTNRSTLVAVLAVALGACGDNTGSTPDPGPSGPFDALPLDQELTFDGLDGPIHVVRDEFGIAHISATSVGDLGFAQGFVMAHDRLPQMDILRRFGAGTLGELFGGLDPSVVDTDLEMRMHRMKPLAEEAYAQLQASSDPDAADIVRLLDRFADGVNAYHARLVAEEYELDPAVALSFDPARFTPWSPIDSLVLGRFQAFSLSFSAPQEIDITDLYQAARATFDQAAAPGEEGHDPELFARRGASADLLRITPVGRIPTIDGFPGADGARAPAAAPTRAKNPTRAQPGAGEAAEAVGAPRPHVPRELLANALAVFSRRRQLGPHAFMLPHAGSNDWVVAPEHAGGVALLAGDQHLALPNPSIFYPVHLIVDDGEETIIDAQGITFPGIPGIILGHNGQLAWTSTTAEHDVNDVYLETIEPCAEGGGDCAVIDGAQVPIETFTEEVGVGVLGTVARTITATYEVVPGHGPIIPTVADGEIVPRTGGQALSVRYTGHQVSQEIRATYGLMRARSVDEGMAALESFDYGAQNWVLADNAGNIGWSTRALVPVRAPAAYTWDPATNPDGLAPFMVLPGDGTAEWEGFLDEALLPQAINPAQGFLVTANSDPVGATFDGDPLDGPVVDGRPLYVGAAYAAGMRTERITQRIEDGIASGQPHTVDTMAAIQHDSRSNFGAHMQPFVATAIDLLDSVAPPPDVAAWLLTLPPERVDRLREAGAFLKDWSLATPPAVSSPSADERRDSVATSLFNVWVHFFIGLSVGDEHAALGRDVFDVSANLTVRLVLALLAEPEDLASGLAVTGQPVLCDIMGTVEIESCDLIVLQALDQAVAFLESPDGMDTADMDQWVWGRMHTLTLKPLFPVPQLEVPPADDPDPALQGGYPKAGDNFAVNRADTGYGDLDFSQNDDGPAQRFIAEIPPGGTVRAHMALPGGVIYNRESGHFRDLMDEYYVPQRHFVIPYSADEIVSAGEERWLLHGP